MFFYWKIIVFLWWSYFLDYSCSLKFCVVLIFKVAVTSSNLYLLLWVDKYLLSAILGILNLCQTFYGYTCSTLLSTSCGRVLKLVCLLSMLQHTRPGQIVSHYFSKGDTKVQVVISFWVIDLFHLSVQAH